MHLVRLDGEGFVAGFHDKGGFAESPTGGNAAGSAGAGVGGDGQHAFHDGKFVAEGFVARTAHAHQIFPHPWRVIGVRVEDVEYASFGRDF